MDFSKRQADPRQHLIGIAFVIAFHVLIVYALVTGLAKKVVDVVSAPIETKLIAEANKPPPAPEIVAPPEPKFEAPPLPFIPPPEVKISAPAPVQTTITVAQPASQPAPAAAATVAPPTAPSPAASAAFVSASVVCSNYVTSMGHAKFPKEAYRLDLEKGDALIQFTVSANGSIKDIRVISASHPIFARNSVGIVSKYECEGQGHDVLVQVPFRYRLD